MLITIPIFVLTHTRIYLKKTIITNIIEIISVMTIIKLVKALEEREIQLTLKNCYLILVIEVFDLNYCPIFLLLLFCVF